jgi:hypothetical protein
MADAGEHPLVRNTAQWLGDAAAVRRDYESGYRDGESSTVVEADDGTELLRITRTEDGRLDVSGPGDRWTEGAARFVAEVRRLLEG